MIYVNASSRYGQTLANLKFASLAFASLAFVSASMLFALPSARAKTCEIGTPSWPCFQVVKKHKRKYRTRRYRRMKAARRAQSSRHAPAIQSIQSPAFRKNNVEMSRHDLSALTLADIADHKTRAVQQRIRQTSRLPADAGRLMDRPVFHRRHIGKDVPPLPVNKLSGPYGRRLVATPLAIRQLKLRRMLATSSVMLYRHTDGLALVELVRERLHLAPVRFASVNNGLGNFQARLARITRRTTGPDLALIARFPTLSDKLARLEARLTPVPGVSVPNDGTNSVIDADQSSVETRFLLPENRQSNESRAYEGRTRAADKNTARHRVRVLFRSSVIAPVRAVVVRSARTHKKLVTFGIGFNVNKSRVRVKPVARKRRMIAKPRLRVADLRPGSKLLTPILIRQLKYRRAKARAAALRLRPVQLNRKRHDVLMASAFVRMQLPATALVRPSSETGDDERPQQRIHLARLDPSFLPEPPRENRQHGIRHWMVVRSGVRTSCFPARLKALLQRVANHYNKPVMVTSGYRSRSYNRRVGGARRSEHINCKAVDFRVPGVDKYALARFVRRLKGRGGVGTYCGSRYIHLDVGKYRQWHWGCRHRRSKRRYAKR